MAPVFLVAAAMLLGANVAVAAASAQAPEGDWVEVHQHERGPVSMDRSSILTEGSIVTVRSRTVLNEVRPDGARTFVVRYRYDCSARTADLLAFATLASDGRILQEEELAPDQRRVDSIGAGSPNETIANQVCR